MAVYFINYNFAHEASDAPCDASEEAGLADHVSSIEEIVGLWTGLAASAREMSTEKQIEWWMGFACKKCGAPCAIQRSHDASKSGQHSARGWRVTCTSCGVTEYYEPGTPMVRMTVSD